MNESNYRTKDCRTCQNMSCRVEQHEKPTKYCIGYINHDFKKHKTTLVKVLSKKCIDTEEKK